MFSVYPSYDIPYVPSSWDRLETMIELSQVHYGDKTVDLGAGDGRVVTAMAKLGAKAQGYEIDKGRAELGQKNIKEEGLTNNAVIYNKNFWNINLGDYNIITLYGITNIMERLEIKIYQEVKPGTKIISNFFPFPTLIPLKKKRSIYLYIPQQ